VPLQKPLSLAVLLAAALVIFVVDLFVPLGWVAWLPYVALVLLTLWVPQPRAAQIVAALCSALIVLGFFEDFYGPQTAEPKMAAFNRGLGVAMLWVIAMLVMMHKRMEAEREQLILQLQEALANVQTLRGFLPICASCKKVRDDQGYWNQIEAYITRHSLAHFIHGLCPQCSTEMMQEIPPRPY
jgi:hypothetical protein